MRRVLVIGGTSGTGAALVRLLGDEDHAVRVLARRPEEARRRLPSAVEVVAGDLRDPSALKAAVAGVDTVVHTAGTRGVSRPRQHEELVVDATADLLRASRLSATSAIVFMSSMGVTRPSLLGDVLNLAKGEALVHKRHAEDLVRRSGLDYLILRAAVLTDRGSHPERVTVSPTPRPLRFGVRVSRADVAAVIVSALRRPTLGRVTADILWERPGRGARPTSPSP
jgi:uncharacterized protein YbjT (DUF2867 family)